MKVLLSCGPAFASKAQWAKQEISLSTEQAQAGRRDAHVCGHSEERVKPFRKDSQTLQPSVDQR